MAYTALAIYALINIDLGLLYGSMMNSVYRWSGGKKNYKNFGPNGKNIMPADISLFAGFPPGVIYLQKSKQEYLGHP